MEVKLPTVSGVLRAGNFYYGGNDDTPAVEFNLGDVLIARGTPVTPSKTMAAWIAALNDWMRIRAPREISFQPLLVSKTLGYSGRPGAIAKLAGGPEVLAIFTASRYSPAVHPVQLGAYRMAYQSGQYPDCEVVTLRADGKCAVQPVSSLELRAGWNVFNAALTTYRWREQHGRL